VVAGSAWAGTQPIYKACTRTGGCKAWNEGKEATPALRATSGPVVLDFYVKGMGVDGSIACAKAKGVGEISGPSNAKLTLTFLKCASGGEACASPGEKRGVIETSPLSTELVEGPEERTGIRYGEAAATYAEAVCGVQKLIFTGVADALVHSVSGKAIEDLFSVNAGGEQANTVDGDVLLTEVPGVGMFEGGQSATIRVTTKEEVRIFL
jgi:hypothetical protein